MSLRVVQSEFDEEFLFEEFVTASTHSESLIKLKTIFDKLLRKKLGSVNIPLIRLILLSAEKFNFSPEQLKVLIILHDIDRVINQINDALFFYILFYSKQVLLQLMQNPEILPPLFSKVDVLADEIELPDVFKRENYQKMYVVSVHNPDKEKNYARLFCKRTDGDSATVILFKPWDIFCAKGILTHGQVIGFYNLKEGEKEGIHICDRNTLMITAPDIILDVTDIKNAIRNVNDYQLTRLFYHKSTNRNQVIGNIVNKLLDELLLYDPVLDADFIKNVINEFKFSLSLAGVRSIDVFDDVKYHMDSIIKSGLIDRIRSAGIFSIEPTFISTEFGISGRIDVFCNDTNEIIELKTGKPKDFGAWINDETQTALYSLMVQNKKDNPNDKVVVFYSKQEKNPFRYLNITYPYSYTDSMIRRNEMIGFDRILAGLNPVMLKEILVELSSYEAGPIQKPLLDKLNFTLGNISNGAIHDLIISYLAEYISFCERERYAQKIDYASLWTKSDYQKKDEFRMLGSIKSESSDVNTSQVTFSLIYNDSKFREGDICLIYDKQMDISGQQIFKGTIKSIDRKSVVVALKNSGALKFLHEDKEWFLESDYMDVGMRKNVWALMDFAAIDERKQKLILGIEEPAFKNDTHSNLPDKLTQKQKQAIESALNAEDYFLIQGPPGTGKTTLLAYLIKSLLEDSSEILLVTAFTNRAVDEIMSKFINETGMTSIIARLGNAYSTDFPEYSVSNLIKSVPDDEVMEGIKSKKVFFSTIATASYNEILQAIDFTTTIVDESSQITEPETLSVVLKTKRFVLIGDEKQLPAVISQMNGDQNILRIATDSKSLNDIGITRLDNSLFERLVTSGKNNKWNSYAMLDTQFRMNSELLEFSNNNFYESALKSGEGNGSLQLEFEENLMSLNAAPIEFFDVKAPGEKKKNRKEADTLIKLLEKYYQKNKSENLGYSFGIIAPFRAQVSYIHQELLSRGIDDVKVDTVERFQGGERDVIFISFTVYHHSQISQIQSIQEYGNIVIDRKLNVALTRAKRKLIMLGNADLLSKNHLFKKLINFCKEKKRFHTAGM
jgi:DNA replication ATP-dependent helicase Dna2